MGSPRRHSRRSSSRVQSGSSALLKETPPIAESGSPLLASEIVIQSSADGVSVVTVAGASTLVATGGVADAVRASEALVWAGVALVERARSVNSASLTAALRYIFQLLLNLRGQRMLLSRKQVADPQYGGSALVKV